MLPCVSVIIPICSLSKDAYLAIDSILNQTFKDIEIILCINGKDVLNIESDLKFKYGLKIRTVTTDNCQLAHALNLGVNESRAPLIARMDSDDVAFPDRLAQQVAFLEDHPEVDLLGTRALVFRNMDDVIGLLPFANTHSEICARPWNGFPLAHPTWMGRSGWFREHKYRVPEYRRAEDQDLLLRTYKTSTFACLSDVLLAYRQGSFSAKKTLVGRTNLLKAQVQHFFGERELALLSKSLLIYGLKSIVDLGATFLRLEQLYFMRMNEKPLQYSVDEFKKIRNSLVNNTILRT